MLELAVLYTNDNASVRASQKQRYKQTDGKHTKASRSKIKGYEINIDKVFVFSEKMVVW